MSLFRISLLAALLALLAACGGEDAASAADAGADRDDAARVGADPPAPATAAADAPEVPIGAFRITELRLGNAIDGEGRVSAVREAFAPGDTFYASVIGVGESPGVTVNARWSNAAGVLIAEQNQPLVPTAPTLTTFSLQHPDGWPVGDYMLAVSINGKLAEARAFAVK